MAEISKDKLFQPKLTLADRRGAETDKVFRAIVEAEAAYTAIKTARRIKGLVFWCWHQPAIRERRLEKRCHHVHRLRASILFQILKYVFGSADLSDNVNIRDITL
jgi:hypothetical protein